MDATISVKDRAELAKLAEVSEQYLYQCLTKRRDMDATQAAVVEAKTSGRIRRWQLRRDWHITWPELIATDGAPPVPEATEKRAA